MYRLNVVINELQLVVALLQDNASISKGSQVAILLAQTKPDLAEATQQITGQDPTGTQE